MFRKKLFLTFGTSLTLIAATLAVDFERIAYETLRSDEIGSITRVESRSNRRIHDQLTDAHRLEKQFTLQEGTEHLLKYGELLRSQIVNTFGRLVFDYYDDFSTSQVGGIYQVYRETFERRYNIFDIVPNLLKHRDLRPSRICKAIHESLQTCLRDSTETCGNLERHDKTLNWRSYATAWNLTSHVYESVDIDDKYPDGFSLEAVLNLLQKNELKMTPGLLTGLLYNVQYDSFDEEIRYAERRLVLYLGSLKDTSFSTGKKAALFSDDDYNDFQTVDTMLKSVLEKGSKVFVGSSNQDAEILAKHVVREVNAISENIEYFGSIYENGEINLDLLFDLIFSEDLVDEDIVDARDYLSILMEKIQMLKYLRPDKYQHVGPDQLMLGILSQLIELNFVTDLAEALRVHAFFWRRTQNVDGLSDLLQLFTAYENLRNVPDYSDFIDKLDFLKHKLENGRNATIEMTCASPRPCLRRGLLIIQNCKSTTSSTKQAIQQVLDLMSSKGSVIRSDCVSSDTREPVSTEIDSSVESTEEIEETHDDASTVTQATSTPTLKKEKTSTESDIRDTTISATTVQDESLLTTQELQNTEETTEVSEAAQATTQEIEKEDTETTEDKSEMLTTEPMNDTEETVIYTTTPSTVTEKSENSKETIKKESKEFRKTTSDNKNGDKNQSNESCENKEDCSGSCEDGACEENVSDCKGETCECEGDECDKSNEKSSEKSNEKSNEKSSEKSNEKSSEKSIEKSSEKSSGKFSEKSSEKSKSVECDNLDCSESVENCEGKDCPKSSENSETKCTGAECNVTTSTEEKCLGDNCTTSQELDCANGSCSTSASNEKCEGDNCNSSEKECSGEDCSTEEPSTSVEPEPGPVKQAATIIEDEILKSVSVPVGCDNSDPSRKRKMERLQKMRILSALHALKAASLSHLSRSEKLAGNEHELIESKHVEKSHHKKASEMDVQGKKTYIEKSHSHKAESKTDQQDASVEEEAHGSVVRQEKVSKGPLLNAFHLESSASGDEHNSSHAKSSTSRRTRQHSSARVSSGKFRVQKKHESTKGKIAQQWSHHSRMRKTSHHSSSSRKEEMHASVKSSSSHASHSKAHSHTITSSPRKKHVDVFEDSSADTSKEDFDQIAEVEEEPVEMVSTSHQQSTRRHRESIQKAHHGKSKKHAKNWQTR